MLTVVWNKRSREICIFSKPGRRSKGRRMTYITAGLDCPVLPERVTGPKATAAGEMNYLCKEQELWQEPVHELVQELVQELLQDLVQELV